MTETARPGSDSGRAVSFPGRLRVLGVPVDAVDGEESLSRCAKFVAEGRPRQVITANPLMILAAEEDPSLKEAFEAADLVIPDGAGLLLAARLQGRGLSRVPGIELMESLCARAAVEGWRVFLLGAAPGVAEACSAALSARYPGLIVAGTRHGYFSDGEGEVIEAVRKSRPDVLFAALPTPFQDAWIHRNLSVLGARVAMGVGGSFDVLSGRLRRAPTLMRRMGLEWLFRLVQEPRRLFRMRLLPVYLLKLLRRT